MKPCIIKQPAGIGDIFFCQKLAKIMMAHDYSVIWPVREDILWIGDYIKDITFVPEHWNFLDQTVFQNAFGVYVGDDMAFISPATADMTHNDGKIMSSKYSMLGLDYHGWQDFFQFERNLEKENKLYYDVLGLKDDSEFVFINNLYNTDIRNSELLSPENYDLPTIELQILDGYTLFDWCKVLEKAKSVYTINTSINYLIDVLDTNYEEYVIIAHDEKNKSEIDYLFRKPHTMICK